MLTSTVTNPTEPVYTDSKTKNDMGQKDIFLKLLVAQMQYQDPMKPQDATAMSQQLAQFNMVEQQTNTNKLLEQLVAAGGSNNAASPTGDGASYLGHTVTINQNFIKNDGTSQNFNVQLEAASNDALIFIYDENGNPVRSMQGTLNAGDNPLTWDGLTDSGEAAPEGTYVVGVSALDLNGNEIPNVVQRTGVVEAVRFTGSGTSLVVNGVPVAMTDISELRM